MRRSLAFVQRRFYLTVDSLTPAIALWPFCFWPLIASSQYGMPPRSPHVRARLSRVLTGDHRDSDSEVLQTSDYLSDYTRVCVSRDIGWIYLIRSYDSTYVSDDVLRFVRRDGVRCSRVSRQSRARTPHTRDTRLDTAALARSESRVSRTR